MLMVDYADHFSLKSEVFSGKGFALNLDCQRESRAKRARNGRSKVNFQLDCSASS
jgi:hypothetical protein